MYLIVDIERNMLICARRDMMQAFADADASEARGVATQVRFEAGFRLI